MKPYGKTTAFNKLLVEHLKTMKLDETIALAAMNETRIFRLIEIRKPNPREYNCSNNWVMEKFKERPSNPKERWIMGVANQDLFKEDRRQEKTLKEIKEFAKRYSIRLDGLSDEEIIQRWNARPKWD